MRRAPPAPLSAAGASRAPPPPPPSRSASSCNEPACNDFELWCRTLRCYVIQNACQLSALVSGAGPSQHPGPALPQTAPAKHKAPNTDTNRGPEKTTSDNLTAKDLYSVYHAEKLNVLQRSDDSHGFNETILNSLSNEDCTDRFIVLRCLCPPHVGFSKMTLRFRV